jgi:hypothetical protein
MFQSSEFIRADQQQTNICFDDFACDGWGRTTSFTSHHGQLLSRWRCGRRSRSRSSGRGAGRGGRAVARRPLDLDVVRVCVDTSYSRALLRGGDALFGCRLVRMLRTPLWGTDVTTDSTSRCSHAGPTSYSANRDDTRGGGVPDTREWEVKSRGPRVLNSSCCAPSVIGLLEDQPGARLQAAGCSLLGPGDNAVAFPRPGATDRAPPPKKKATQIPVYIPSSKTIGLNPHPKTLGFANRVRLSRVHAAFGLIARTRCLRRARTRGTRVLPLHDEYCLCMMNKRHTVFVFLFLHGPSWVVQNHAPPTNILSRAPDSLANKVASQAGAEVI